MSTWSLPFWKLFLNSHFSLSSSWYCSGFSRTFKKISTSRESTPQSSQVSSKTMSSASLTSVFPGQTSRRSILCDLPPWMWNTLRMPKDWPEFDFSKREEGPSPRSHFEKRLTGWVCVTRPLPCCRRPCGPARGGTCRVTWHSLCSLFSRSFPNNCWALGGCSRGEDN